jgi:flagellar biosynthesis protein FliQ
MNSLSSSSVPAPDSGEVHDWPLRAWGLALLGGLAGLAIHFLVKTEAVAPAKEYASDLRLAAATFVGVGALMFGVLVERTRVLWSLGFAAFSAAIVAFTTYWNGPFGWGNNEEPWRLACALLSVVIAAPLFQAWRSHYDEAPGRFVIPYHDAYHHAWTNVVLWCAAWAFVGVTWLMAFLLGSLFKLIGIALLRELLDKDWMILLLTGAALGAGIALLRDREHILGLLQRVVTTVLAVLAPVLALGLIVFLLAIPFTGLAPLWNATKSTTPILLGCIIGALCLANAVIGETDAQGARSPVLRVSAVALGLTMLPLAIIAAISTGSRIHQYGLTPERLWAVVFTAIACAYGLAYLVTLVHRRTAAACYVRTANQHLAIGLCALAFVLSTPLVNFGALSTSDQLARLQNGTTPADRFDWRALRFDFGKSGLEATKKLAKQGATPAIRDGATEVLKAKDRWVLNLGEDGATNRPIDQTRLTILPRKIALPAQLLKELPTYHACGQQGACTIIHDAGSNEAVIQQGGRVHLWKRKGDKWAAAPNINPYPNAERLTKIENSMATRKVEIRNITRRQLFVDGEPIGDLFE